MTTDTQIQQGIREAQLPDGTILEFPAGTSDEVIQNSVRNILGIQASGEPVQAAQDQKRFVPGTTLGTLEPLIRGAAEAIPAAIVGVGETGRGITQTLGAGAEALNIPGGAQTREIAARQQARIEQGLEERGLTERPAFQIGRTIGRAAPFAAIPGGAATTAGRAGLGAVGGALEGLTRPTGEQRGLTEDITQRGGQAVISGAGGAVAAGVLGAVPGLFERAGRIISRTPKPAPTVPNSRQFKDLAASFYRQADEAGGVLKPQFTNKFVDATKKFAVRTKAGKLVAGRSSVDDVIDNIEGLRNRPISLEEAQEIDEALGSFIDKATDQGRLTKEGKRIFDIQTEFRRLIEDADENFVEGGKQGFNALKKARAAWATSRRLDDIERIIERAELTDNPGNAIKSGFRSLLTNKKRIKGYTPQERTALKRAAQTGISTDLLRQAGSRLNAIIALSTGEVATAGGFAALGSAARGVAGQQQLQRALEAQRIIGGQTLPRGSISTVTGAALGQPTAEQFGRVLGVVSK